MVLQVVERLILKYMLQILEVMHIFNLRVLIAVELLVLNLVETPLQIVLVLIGVHQLMHYLLELVELEKDFASTQVVEWDWVQYYKVMLVLLVLD